jgi:flavin reductase (DIM6/NTAB) family NADH-FMN oxidoreductase RutF
MKFTAEMIASMEKEARRRLINCLAGFKSANLIGTVSADGIPNVAIFNSVIHLGADPALIGFIQRPASVERHTYENIKATGYYTINQVNKDIVKQAHQTSARYTREQSEFQHAGLTPYFMFNNPAPYVKESRLRVGCKFKGEIPIPFNDTILVVGEIMEIWSEQGIIQEDGFIDLVNAGAVAITGLDTYHPVREGIRLRYAKPDRAPEEIEIKRW